MAPKTYKILADLTAAVHVGWIVLSVGGAIFMFFYPPYAWVQIALMTVVLLSSLPFHRICPLTLLEERLRQKIDPGYTNQGSFTVTYARKVFGINIKSRRQAQIILSVFYVAAYAAAILLLVFP